MMTAVDEMRPIAGYEGMYSVTRDGRVWSHPKRWIGPKGCERSHDGKWLKFGIGSHGYKVVNLYRDRAVRQILVHRAVAEAWIPNINPAEFVEINHIDGVKTNSIATNLEWCTPSHNRRHAVDLGLLTVTERTRAACRRTGLRTRKLTLETAEIVRARIAAGAGRVSLAKEYGVSRATIGNIINRIRYTQPDAPGEPNV